MYPFLLPDILGYTIAMYDVMIMIGVFAMLGFVAVRFEKHDGFDRKQTNQLLIFLIISMVAALISAYVLDGIFHFIANYGYLHDEGYSFIEIVRESFKSITFIGGLIGGITVFILLVKYKFKNGNRDLKKILNTVIIGVVLAHAFGRIGCFTAGCCYGIPTDSFLGVSFPNGESNGIPVFPTQLFSSAFLFILFILLNKVKKFKTIELEMYLIWYGTFRFLVEFIRGDDRGSILSFITTQYNALPSPSQYLSMLLIILGIYLLKRNKNKNQNKMVN